MRYSLKHIDVVKLTAVLLLDEPFGALDVDGDPGVDLPKTRDRSQVMEREGQEVKK